MTLFCAIDFIRLVKDLFHRRLLMNRLLEVEEVRGIDDLVKT